MNPAPSILNHLPDSQICNDVIWLGKLSRILRLIGLAYLGLVARATLPCVSSFQARKTVGKTLLSLAGEHIKGEVIVMLPHLQL